MSLEKDINPGNGDLATLIDQAASAIPVHNEPESYPPAWHFGAENSLVAAAATSGPPPNQADSFSLYSGYGNAFVAHALIQRKAEGEEFSGFAGVPPQTATGSSGVAPAIPATTSAQGLIVEDAAETVGPEQMKKNQFLGELRTAVSNTTAEVLAGSPWAMLAASYISATFAQYSSQSPQQIEQSIRRYAPEAAGVTSARGFIPIITARVRRSVTIWLATGEITGVPQGMPLALPGAGLAGAVGNAASGLAGAATNVVSAVGGVLSSIGSVLFKERDGNAAEADNPGAIQAQLGAGQSLDGDVRSRMESAFGESFSGVEVHADSGAAKLSDDLNSRAFTVGHHIAFGAGEYHPGTPIGDALIAHELAHVAQQRGAPTDSGPAQKGTTGYGALEQDADEAAVGAVVYSWGGAKGLAGIAKRAMPSLKSSLRLQRCDKTSKGPIAAPRLATARTNFRNKNSHLSTLELDKIDAAINAVSADNINLQIAFYDYYSGHNITKMGTAEAAKATKSGQYANTKPLSDTIVRPDLLDPGFPVAKLGSLLIHEFTHTRHDTNIMGSRDYQEGESYGVEYFFAERAGEKTRMAEIMSVMSKPSSLTMPIGIPALRQAFTSQYATMQGLYEIIDKGTSSHPGSPFVTPALLTAAEARALAAELVSSQELNRSARLQTILTWVTTNIGSFVGVPPV